MNDLDKLEAVKLDVWKNKIHRRLLILYNPPLNKPDLTWLEAIWSPGDLMYGDMNAPSTRWKYPSTTPVGRILEDFIDGNPAQFIDNEEEKGTFVSSSGSASHPDIIISHSSLAPEILHTLMPAPGSFGHKLMKITLVDKSKKNNYCSSRKVFWNTKKANWDRYRTLCEKSLTESLVQNNIDVTYRAIKEAILKSASQAIPRGHVKKYKPFWSEKLSVLKQKRDQAREVFETHHRSEDKKELNKLAKEFRKEISESKRKKYRNYLEELDYKKDGIGAHQFLSKLCNYPAPKSINPIKTPSGKLLTCVRDIADFFCSHYAKISNSHTSVKKISRIKVPTCLNERENLLFCKPFTLDEIQKAIGHLKKKKSPGPDQIIPEHIINLGPSARATILKFMNIVWKSYIPSDWCKADIIPVPKKNKASYTPENFRPIALTSIFSKLFERLILKRLQIYLEERKLISDKQAGFRKHRNTVEQVAYLSQCIKNGFNRKQSTLAVFVDLKNAFDRVSREILLQKMKDMGIDGNMHKSISSFLAQRFIRVRLNDVTSSFKQTRQGVPQGTVLSPTLFNIMVNDIVDILEATPGINTLLYADDLVIWATSSNVKALENTLNHSLDLLSQWVTDNLLEVNPLKSMYQLFTLSTRNYNLNIKYKGEPLARENSIVYLGVQLDCKLSWKKHIEKQAKQGENRLNLLKRLAGIKWGANQDTLVMAYKTYLRPALEYAQEVTLTANCSNFKPVDLIQNKALRIITGAPKSTPITAMEVQTRLEPLKNRREVAAFNLMERVKRINVEHWMRLECASQRLKTQQTLSSRVDDIMVEYGIEPGERQPFPSDFYYAERAPVVRLSLEEPIIKQLASPYVLKSLALETINVRYPAHMWFHVYTDGSATSANKNAGAGVYSQDFTISEPVGLKGTNFDGEIKAISLALDKVKSTSHTRVVLLIDSQAAILAAGGREVTDSNEVIECRKKISALIRRGVHLELQWIPSHVGLYGNEQADKLARLGSAMAQPNVPLPYSSIKRIMKATATNVVQNRHRNEAEGKQWEFLLTNPIPLHLKRDEAVACFRTATGHDYLQAHLHKIGVVDSPSCPLCLEGIMNGEHLFYCEHLTTVLQNSDQLNDFKKMTKLYWAARSQMILQSTT